VQELPEAAHSLDRLGRACPYSQLRDQNHHKPAGLPSSSRARKPAERIRDIRHTRVAAMRLWRPRPPRLLLLPQQPPAPNIGLPIPGPNVRLSTRDPRRAPNVRLSILVQPQHHLWAQPG
jgi:hypothetical protein